MVMLVITRWYIKNEPPKMALMEISAGWSPPTHRSRLAGAATPPVALPCDCRWSLYQSAPSEASEALALRLRFGSHGLHQFEAMAIF